MCNRAPAFGPRVARLACLAAFLAACSAPLPPATPQSANPTNAATPNASVSKGGIEFMVSGSGPQLAAYQALVTLYQQRHPGQTVNLVGIPGDTDLQGRLAADIAAGTPADVIVQSYTNVPRLASRGLLAPLAPYLAASRSLKLTDFPSEVYSPFIFGRQLECVPLSASGLVVYYNKDLFQKAGLAVPGNRWTKQAFVADAQALTRDTNGDGQPDQYGLGLSPSLLDLTPFIWQLKGSLVDNEAWPTELAMGAPAVLTATTWLVSLQTHDHLVPDQQAELAASSDQRFQDGSLAMIINTPASVPAYRQITAFDWDVAPLPTNNATPTNVLVADGLCLTAASANKTAAWQFIEFAASAEGQALLAQAGAIVPAQTVVAHSPAFLNAAARPAHSQVFLDALSYALPLPKLGNWADIQAIADEELQQAFYGQKDIGQALLAVTTRSEEYFKIHIAQ
jgi:multiple sugar transport system substrate-binding protein